MKKTLLEKRDLAARLASYAASTGALLALGSVSQGQVVYSGIQNLEVNMPDEYLEIDMNGDTIPDFGFYMYGVGSFGLTYYGYNYFYYGKGFAAILNPRTTLYANSWMMRYTYYTYNYLTYTYPMANGLGTGVLVDSAQTLWTNLTYAGYPGYQGYLAYGYYTYSFNSISYTFNGYAAGDFFAQERYIGVRFYIGAEQHYGWIRASTSDMLDPLTIIDWAYENTPGEGIYTGEGDVFGPEVTIEPGVTSTTEPTVLVSIYFNERAYNFNISDIKVTNGLPDNLTEIVAGREYTVEVTAAGGGDVVVALPAGAVIDFLGNENELASATWTHIPPVSVNVKDAEGIHIFPNPVNDLLSIRLDTESAVQIMDMNGKIVYMQDKLFDETIDVSGFNPGIYIVQIRSNENITQHKIIIE
jgi:hypothetical protein